jgi:phage tail sheath protein FI
MSQDDIRAGVLKLNVAFAPAFVAEFIEVNIEQIFEPG